MNSLYKILRAIVKPFVFMLFRINVFGKENIPKENGCVLCCNHTSVSDVFFLAVTCQRQINFMGKKELFRTSLTRCFFSALGGISVDRGASDKGAVKKAIDVCNRGDILGIFPEGTRNRDGAPKKAKAGAAMIALESKADILPVAIYRENPKLKLFQKVTVRFGKPISYDEYADNFEDKISKTQLRNISNLIIENITELWEKKH